MTSPVLCVRHFEWQWQERRFQVTYETMGVGSSILLLPAFSTVCSGEEMRPLVDRLAASDFGCTLLDWPGFGSSDHERLEYGPALYHRFLANFAATTLMPGTAVGAAGA